LLLGGRKGVIFDAFSSARQQSSVISGGTGGGRPGVVRDQHAEVAVRLGVNTDDDLPVQVLGDGRGASA